MIADEKLAPTLKVIETGTAVVPVIESQELFRGGKQLMVLHAGQVYTLRQTRDNKLILTK